jgi:transcriptional regulator with XRE-family HTH domain
MRHDLFAERLHVLRRRHRWTQQELAKRAQVSAITISRLERGETRQVSAEIVSRLAQALETSTDYLLGLQNEEGDG